MMIARRSFLTLPGVGCAAGADTRRAGRGGRSSHCRRRPSRGSGRGRRDSPWARQARLATPQPVRPSSSSPRRPYSARGTAARGHALPRPAPQEGPRPASACRSRRGACPDSGSGSRPIAPSGCARAPCLAWAAAPRPVVGGGEQLRSLRPRSSSARLGHRRRDRRSRRSSAPSPGLPGAHSAYRGWRRLTVLLRADAGVGSGPRSGGAPPLPSRVALTVAGGRSPAVVRDRGAVLAPPARVLRWCRPRGRRRNPIEVRVSHLGVRKQPAGCPGRVSEGAPGHRFGGTRTTAPGQAEEGQSSIGPMTDSEIAAADLARGAGEVLPAGALVEQLAEGPPAAGEMGIDRPRTSTWGTSSSSPKLAQFQEAGHSVILIIGDHGAGGGPVAATPAARCSRPKRWARTPAPSPTRPSRSWTANALGALQRRVARRAGIGAVRPGREGDRGRAPRSRGLLAMAKERPLSLSSCSTRSSGLRLGQPQRRDRWDRPSSTCCWARDLRTPTATGRS